MKNINTLANHPTYVHGLFISLFLLFGLSIMGISYFAAQHYHIEQTQSEILDSAKDGLKVKKRIFKNIVNNYTETILAIRKNKQFHKYLELNDLRQKTVSTDLFLTIAKSDKNIMQLRYIDENGLENIRVDRKEIGFIPSITSKKLLQNKFSRYYFQDTAVLEDGKIWYSKIDLNMEYGKIVKPIVPTLRIGTPVYLEGKFKGIIIVNIFFKDILNNITQSGIFNISLLDKDKYFIIHKMKTNGIEEDYSWSKYLNLKHNLDDHRDQIGKDQNYGGFYSENISDILPNEDNLTMMFEVKEEYLEKVNQDHRDFIISVGFIILVISIPLALLISTILQKLSMELITTQQQLQEEYDIIDEFVFLSTADINGNITNTTSAYTKMSGYTKDEMLGRAHNMMRHPETEKDIYKELWKTIKQGKVWKGEIKNVSKDGVPYWTDVTIKPIKDVDGLIKGYSAYRTDITYQKKVEDLSIKDELTKLYNRRFFNDIIPKEMNRLKRDEKEFGFIIFDVDHFKQYNDTYGHTKGDEVLQSIGKLLNEILHRASDYGFRIGGEEFAIFFSGVEHEKAVLFAHKVKTDVENLGIIHENNSASKYVTISLGLVTSKSAKSMDIDEIYKQADEELYRAKHSGRNKVCYS